MGTGPLATIETGDDYVLLRTVAWPYRVLALLPIPHRDQEQAHADQGLHAVRHLTEIAARLGYRLRGERQW